MRLFTGLSISGEILTTLAKVIGDLRASAPLRWSPPENLHITTKFIGDWPDDRLDEMRQVLGELEPPGPLRITVSRFGFWPNPHHPRILFAAVQTDDKLYSLARRIEDALVALGVPAEKNPYTPHVTLARIRTEDIMMLRERIAQMGNMNHLDFGTFEPEEFHLYASQPSAVGSVYTRLASWPLARNSGAPTSRAQKS